MKVHVDGAGEVTLGRGDFVSEGAQGAVYARDGVAYKVYHDPAHMIPAGKFDALAAIDDRGVLRPQAMVRDGQGRAVGFTMDFLEGTEPLCRLMTKTFREQHRVSGVQVLSVVEGMRDRLARIHAADVLVVDLNPLNLLLSSGLSEVFFIDVDSYQTARYPATAIADSIRDRHARPGEFTAETDWFAFAVIAFQLFVGVHPYRGHHPSLKTMDARMEANVSVLRPEVKVPASAYPFEDIPAVWRSWFERVLDGQERSKAPGGAAMAVVGPARPARPVMSTGRFELRGLETYDGVVVACFGWRGRACVVTRESVWLDGRPVQATPAGQWAIGVSGKAGRPVLAWLEDGRVKLMDLDRQVPVACELAASELAMADTRVLARCGESVVEVELVDVGAGVVAAPRVVAQVMAKATRLWPGVAVQNMLGATWVSLFDAPGRCRQVRVKELDGHRVIDARFERGVLVVTAERAGRFDRIVFRFAADFGSYDVRRTEDVSDPAVAFVVLDTGVAVQLTEDGQLEVFVAKMGHPAVQVIEDPLLGRDLRLFGRDGQLSASRGRQVFGLSMR